VEKSHSCQRLQVIVMAPSAMSTTVTLWSFCCFPVSPRRPVDGFHRHPFDRVLVGAEQRGGDGVDDIDSKPANLAGVTEFR